MSTTSQSGSGEHPQRNERGMMVGRFPKKVGVDTVALDDECPPSGCCDACYVLGCWLTRDSANGGPS